MHIANPISSPVYTEKTECQDCYKCLRECPLKSIRVESGSAAINAEDCIYCGYCTSICPVKAKRIRNDVSRVKKILNSGEEVWLSLAPSYVAEFGNVPSEVLIGAIRKLGFAGVSETAIGADLVSKEIAKQTLEYKDQKLFISTACPAIVRYIERYVPNLHGFLVKCGSPLQLHSEFLRQTLKRKIHVVFAGPCAAKKMESDRWPEAVELAIGFSELRQMFEENGISLDAITENEYGRFYPNRAALGMIYPLDSGMCRSLQSFADLAHPQLMYKSFSGLKNVQNALEGFNPELLERPLFIELLACAGGCINGPMMSRGTPILSREIVVENHAARYQESPTQVNINYAVAYNVRPIEPPKISPERITEALQQVGKYAPEDELNCSGCGYDSCRDFARALVQKKAEKTQCVSYMRKLANKKASMLMQSMPSGVALINRDLNIVECNQNFAKLIGTDAMMIFEARPGMEGAQIEKLFPHAVRYLNALIGNPKERPSSHVIHHADKVYQCTVFSIEKEELVGLILQDCTVPHIRRDQVIEKARTVIEKNLKTVQNIAFLLGENAAESESILNSIIENFSGEKGDEAP